MRHRRVWRLVLTGAAAALVLGLAAFAVFTRTRWGRENVLEYTLGAVGGRLHGRLDIGGIDGNLVTGAKLYEIELRGADSALIVSADSAYVNYELPSFFGGDIVLRSLVLYDGRVFLQKVPGDSLWNYQKVLLDTTAVPGDPAAARATIINAARLVNGEVTVDAPWEPARNLNAADRESAIREALADTSRLEVTRVATGYLRRMFFEVSDARVSDLVIASDERGGTYLRVDSAAARAQLYRGDPLDLVNVGGQLSMRNGVVHYRADSILLPSSRMQSVGTIDMSGEVPRYDLQVSAPRVTLADLTWLYPMMPEGGEAAFEMSLETRDELTTLYRFRDLTFTAPGTRVRGSFGLLVGEAMEFTDANLTAAPLRVETIEEMLPAGLPVSGLRIGEVEIRSSGPATAGARATG